MNLKPIALASSAGIIAIVLIVFQMSDTTRPEIEQPEAYLTLHEGDLYTYRFIADGQELGMLNIEVGPQRTVLAADGTLRPAAPLILTQVSQGQRQDAGVAYLGTDGAGLIFQTDTCIYLKTSCGSDQDVLLLWQECPYGGIWSPLDILPWDVLRYGKQTVLEPIFGENWTINVSKAGSKTIVAIEANGIDPSCNPSGTLTLKNGVVEKIEREGGMLVLHQFKEGPGAPMNLNKTDATIRLANPRMMDSPVPSGAELIGPKEWTLQAAWDLAKTDSRVTSFTNKYPGALLLETGSDQDKTAFGDSYVWYFTLLGENAEKITVTTTHTTGFNPSNQVDVKGPEAVSEVQPGYTLPLRPLVALDELFNRLDGVGLQSLPRDVAFHFTIGPDGPRPIHTVVLGSEVTSTGDVSGEVLRHYASVNPWTGRITDGVFELEEARRIAGS